MSECQQCGGELLMVKAGSKFCGPNCRETYWTAHKAPRPLLTKACAVCASAFRSSDPRKVYCSAACNFKAQNAKRETTKQQIRTCPTCAKEFKPNQKRGVGRTFCSSTCRREAWWQKQKRHSHEWPGRKIYKWQGNWYKALQRDKFTCQACGSYRPAAGWVGNYYLEVHHRDGTGEKTAKNHALDNLLTLCRACHRDFHHLTLIYKDGQYSVAGSIFDKLGLTQVPCVTLPS